MLDVLAYEIKVTRRKPRLKERANMTSNFFIGKRPDVLFGGCY
jgi:hypothetical protein